MKYLKYSCFTLALLALVITIIWAITGKGEYEPIVGIIGGVSAIIGLITEKSTTRDTTSESEIKSYYFIGVGLGNRISLLPIEEKNVVLDEFIDRLKKIKTYEKNVNTILSKIKKIRLAKSKDNITEEMLTDYFSEMNYLQNAIEENAPPLEYSYFLLAKSIYDVASSKVFEEQGIPNVNDIEDQHLALINAKEKINLPENLQKQVEEFIAISHSGNADATYRQAQKITKQIVL